MSAETQPISVGEFAAAISDLSDEVVVSVKHKLEVSILKLEETNAYLQTEIESVNSSESDQDDVKLYRDTMDENKEVICSQKERVKMIESELEKRGLIGSTSAVISEEKQVDDGGIDL